jgi:hypothetical protein
MFGTSRKKLEKQQYEANNSEAGEQRVTSSY